MTMIAASPSPADPGPKAHGYFLEGSLIGVSYDSCVRTVWEWRRELARRRNVADHAIRVEPMGRGG